MLMLFHTVWAFIFFLVGVVFSSAEGFSLKFHIPCKNLNFLNFGLMKKLLLVCAAFAMAACGSSSDAGWKTTDLGILPLEGTGEGFLYVDVAKGREPFIGSFSYATLYYDGCAIVDVCSDGYRFLDKKGELMSESPFMDMTIFHDGMAWVVQTGKPLMAVNKKLETLFEFKEAEEACAFHEGYAAFSNIEGLWGLVDKTGKVVVTPQWSDVVPMVVNDRIVAKDADWGWFLSDTEGNVLSEYYSQMGTKNYEEGFLQNYVQALQKGRIPVKNQNGKWGIIDRKGASVINPQFDEIMLDGDNYLFRKGYLYGWCDKNGQYIINPQFSDAVLFGGRELAAVKNRDGEWGYIDREGKWAINPQFRRAQRFLASGIAPVQDESSREWGAIDETGKWVINPQFRSMYDYGDESRLLVMDQTRNFGIIDKEGKYLVSPEYPNASKELLSNVSGVGAKYKAKSDYVDVEGYAKLIEGQILALKVSTTGELLSAFGLKESRFPKNGGSVTLCKKNAAPDMVFKIEVSGINAWNKASDGWFGYNYTFRPDIPVDSYMLGVEFGDNGRAWRFVDDIFAVLKEKYPYNAEDGLFTIPGYSLVFGMPVSHGGMVFQIKPNK